MLIVLARDSVLYLQMNVFVKLDGREMVVRSHLVLMIVTIEEFALRLIHQDVLTVAQDGLEKPVKRVVLMAENSLKTVEFVYVMLATMVQHVILFVEELEHVWNLKVGIKYVIVQTTMDLLMDSGETSVMKEIAQDQVTIKND